MSLQPNICKHSAKLSGAGVALLGLHVLMGISSLLCQCGDLLFLGMHGGSGSLHLNDGLCVVVLVSSFSGRGVGFYLLHVLLHGCHFLPQLLLGGISVSAHNLGLLQCTITLFCQQAHKAQSIIQLFLALLHVRQKLRGALGSLR